MPQPHLGDIERLRIADAMDRISQRCSPNITLYDNYLTRPKWGPRRLTEAMRGHKPACAWHQLYAYI
jgi:hypothetical protein